MKSIASLQELESLLYPYTVEYLTQRFGEGHAAEEMVIEMEKIQNWIDTCCSTRCKFSKDTSKLRTTLSTMGGKNVYILGTGYSYYEIPLYVLFKEKEDMTFFKLAFGL